ncbi:MAG: HD domain-containing protein [Pseudomonadota bacterium]|nr:HD domain-containing protein [Pseudomonadota bacterium]
MTPDALFAPRQALAARLLPEALPAPADGAPGGPTDGAHDLAHLARVWANVRRIMAVEGGDEEILAAATLLHDCVAVEKNSPDRPRASRLAAERACEVLAGLGWTADRIGQAAHAIAAHSFSARIEPETPEARILQDADRLDALGFVGVARCFYTAGRLGGGLCDPLDPLAAARPLDDAAHALDHFPAKLFGLAEGFRTAEGARLARARHARLTAFHAGFLDEIGVEQEGQA